MSGISAVIGLIALHGTRAVAASEPPQAGRPHDQLWVVSCRNVAYGRQDDLQQLRYSVYGATTGWSPSSHEAFRNGSQPGMATCVIILGNGYTASETENVGGAAYRQIASGMPPEPAVRCVIWSWPSDHADLGPIKDVRYKASRTPQVAHCFARWLDDVQSPAAGSPGTVSLLGTSFGARILMEALELRAGGRLGELRLESRSPPRGGALNVVLISAAIDNDWLLPGRRLNAALSQVDRLLLINNSSDSVLKRYHWLYGPRSKAAALGSAGLRAVGPRDAGKVMQIDAASIIGRRHGCGHYFESPRLLASMRGCLFGAGSNSPAGAPPQPPDFPPAEGAPIPIASRGEGEVRRK